MFYWALTKNENVERKFLKLWKLVESDIEIKEKNPDFAKSILKAALENQILITFFNHTKDKSNVAIVEIAISAIKSKLITKKHYNTLHEFHEVLNSFMMC